MTPWEIQTQELANCNYSYGFVPASLMACPRAGAAQRFVVISLNIHNRL